MKLRERIKKWASSKDGTDLLVTAALILMALALAGGILLIARFAINEHFRSRYRKEAYAGARSEEEALLYLNEPEGYVPLYNTGNTYFKEGNYPEAAGYYEQALLMHPKNGKECPIRVNYALSILYQYDFEHLGTGEEKQAAIEALKEARKILCEEGCADPDGTDGHDPEAEKLVKKYRFRKSFQFSLRGWAEAQAVLALTGERAVTANAAARNTAELLKSLLVPKKKKQPFSFGISL